MQFTALWSVVAWCVLVALGWVASGLAIAQWCVVIAAAVCGMVTLTRSAKLRYARVVFYDGAFAGAYYVLGETRRLLEFFATARTRFESRDGTLVVVSTFIRSLVGKVVMDKVEDDVWYVTMVRALAGSLSRVLQTLVVFAMVALVRHLLLRSYELGFFRRVLERILAAQERASDVVNQTKEFAVCQVGCTGCVQRRWVRELLGVALPAAAEEELAWCFSQSTDEAHRNAKHLWAMNGDALVKLFVVKFAMSFESAVPGEVSAALQLRTSNEAMLRALEKHEWFSEVKASYKDGYVSAKAGGTIFEALVHVAAKYSDGLVYDTSLRSGVLRALSVE